MTDIVLVTGGSGFVAQWVIAGLLKRGYAVRTTLRSAAKEAAVRAAIAAEVDAGDRLSFAQADLTSDAGWDDAAAGCAYVLHVASPMSHVEGSAEEMVAAARDGTLRVLRAGVKAGVRRIVFTSSCAACASPLQGPDSTNDETVWTDPGDPANNAYRLSKVLAERAAWDFMGGEGRGTEFVTVLPSAVFGPALAADQQGSVQVINSVLQGKMPGLPRIGFCVVDVRDLAEAHIAAMITPEAAGERFIAAGGFMWMSEIAQALRGAFGARAPKVPTRQLPDWLVRLLARFIKPMRQITPTLGRKHQFSADKARRVLGFAPRPAQETVVATGEYLLTNAA